MNRLCIYPQDAAIFLGISIQHARKILREIKKKHNRHNSRFVTVEEFCSYTGLSPQKVYAELQ